MTGRSKTKCIGILTSGGDCPGLNAAIRSVAKTSMNEYGIKVIGILDGFRGLIENRTVPLDDLTVSGILTRGGTILGTSRDKPHKLQLGGEIRDMTAVAVENAHRLQIDCLVCLGGGGTQKNAFRLHEVGGLNVMTLPKTIDNDVPETDISFGFDTAMNIATEAIDRLHTTATSHHRIIVCEVMGHKAGWLALGAGVAGGADVILVPEFPYDLEIVAEWLNERRRSGKRFSIVAVSEGARSKAEVELPKKLPAKPVKKANRGSSEGEIEDETRDGMPLVVRRVRGQVISYHVVQEPMASRVARQLQELTGTEARVTSLGHVQRGGIPSPFDRMLCSMLGTKAAELLAQGKYNCMVAYRGVECVPVPLDKVAGVRKVVTPDDPIVRTARHLGTCLGDLPHQQGKL
jgi:ATP-dependent phosphofructokinase / diphosphate-dependent phosphofructokinase